MNSQELQQLTFCLETGLWSNTRRTLMAKRQGGRWSCLICLCCLCWASERDMMFCWLPACTLCGAAPLSAVSGPRTMDGLRSFCHCPVLVNGFYWAGSQFPDIFAGSQIASISVSFCCHCQSLHNYYFRAVQSQPAIVVNITEIFRVSGSELRISRGGLCL